MKILQSTQWVILAFLIAVTAKTGLGLDTEGYKYLEYDDVIQIAQDLAEQYPETIRMNEIREKHPTIKEVDCGSHV